MRGSFEVLVEVRDRHPRRSPALRGDATQGAPEVGRFSEQEWGDSDERHHPDVPHPVLALRGEQGSGKSTGTRTLAGLLDPSPAQVRKPPREVDAWVTAAGGRVNSNWPQGDGLIWPHLELVRG